MKATAQLHELGQSLWLDSITREMLDRGTLARYVDELSVSGLTSNPTIFEKAIGSGAYDAEIRQKRAQGKSGEELFFELAQEDLARAATLFRPIHQRTHRVDGWVSLEVSPRLGTTPGARSARRSACTGRRASRTSSSRSRARARGCPRSRKRSSRASRST